MTTYDEAIDALKKVEENAENRGIFKWSGYCLRLLESLQAK